VIQIHNVQEMMMSPPLEQSVMNQSQHCRSSGSQRARYQQQSKDGRNTSNESDRDIRDSRHTIKHNTRHKYSRHNAVVRRCERDIRQNTIITKDESSVGTISDLLRPTQRVAVQPALTPMGLPSATSTEGISDPPPLPMTATTSKRKGELIPPVVKIKT
jgi:hypothetical protein